MANEKWIAILSLEDLRRETKLAKLVEDDDAWHDRLPESLPCLASVISEPDVMGYTVGWQFVEMALAVRLTGFARLCGHCRFGHVVTNVKTGVLSCTHCSAMDASRVTEPNGL